MTLSAFWDFGAAPEPFQLSVWFMKSYSSQTSPPSAVGIIVPVPTSNTPHPQAQAKAAAGEKTARQAADSTNFFKGGMMFSHKI